MARSRCQISELVVCMKQSSAGNPDLEQDLLEDAIARVKGVYACQVVLGDDQLVQEIHVVGAADRSAKQIVRDIETLLRVRFGASVDYRKISLVQLDETATKLIMARPQLCRVEATPIGDGYSLTVVIQQDSQEFRAVDEGGRTLAERLQLAGRATLNAVGQIVRRDRIFKLDDLRLLTLGGKEVVAVAVTAWFPSGSETMVGLSVVREGDDLIGELLAASARATLGALNRRLPVIRSSLGAN